MKKILFAGVALAALVASPALAADLRRPPPPAVKAPPPVVPIFSWTGCYFGGHVGGLWASKDWVDATTDLGGFYAATGTSLGGHDVDSFLGGVQAGCDYQFAGGFVIGIAGDYAWTDASNSHLDPFGLGVSFGTKIESLATVTGRIGYAWDRFLGYVKGGGAWERDEFSVTDPGVFGVAFVSTTSVTRSGWTIGVGGEYAFTNYLTGFIEYNYYDFGSKQHAFGTPVGTFLADIDETKSVVKAGLNFRFGGWGAPPVAARY
jgi:outer membrane immunogenic protein